MAMIDNLKKAILDSDFRTMRLLIPKIKKRGTLGPIDKLIISQAQVLLGEHHKALKMLGPELEELELKIISEEEYALQGQVAYLLAITGADNSARRLVKKLGEMSKEEGIRPDRINKKYYLQLIHNCRMWSEFEEGLRLCNQQIENPRTPEQLLPLYLTEKGKMLVGLRRESESLETSEQVLELYKGKMKDRMKIGTLFLNNAICYLGLNQDDKARNELDKLEKLYSDADEVPKFSSYHLVSGIYYIRCQQWKLAEEHLGKSIALLYGSKHIPGAILLAYYWQEQIPGLQKSLEDKITLRCNRAYTPYKHLLGIPYRKNGPRPWCLGWEEKYKDMDYDCWVINSKSAPDDIFPAKYNDIVGSEMSGGELIDLFSGYIFQNGKIAKNMTEAQLRCICSIIESSTFGISKWALLDSIYREENFSFQLGEQRFKALLRSLRKDGFEVNLKSNYYYSPIDKEKTYLLPMFLPTKRDWALIKAVMASFTRKELQDFLGISKTSAHRFISKWQEEGLLVSDGQSYYFG
jgi:tetratricopeptide (TPR) repeat protein